MKKLSTNKIKKLNEQALTAIFNDEINESLLGAIGRGLGAAAKAGGKVAARSTSSVGRSSLKRAAISRVGRAKKAVRRGVEDVADVISDVRTGSKTASRTRAAQRAASAPGAALRQATAARNQAAAAKNILDREALLQDALNASRNTPMDASQAARRLKAERALQAGNLDDAELALGLREPVKTGAVQAASGGSNLAAAGGAAAGAALGSGGQQGFLSKQFGEVEDAALKGAAENVFGDLKRTFANTGAAVGSRINIQNRFRGLR